MDVSLESAVNASWAATDPSGRLAGRPLEEWNAAYLKVESYFHALRDPQQGAAGPARASRPGTRHAARAQEPDRSATELAAEEMDQLVTEWFARCMERIPTGVEQMLSTRGRLALLLADMPGKWQDQFLQPGPWPEEFVNGMRETYLRAGPDFQLSQMAPRPLDLGPIATLTDLSRLPYVKWVLIWLGFGAAAGRDFRADASLNMTMRRPSNRGQPPEPCRR